MPQSQAQVIYDGQCPLCLRSVALLKRLDWLGRFTYVDARDPKRLPRAGPSPERFLEEMHLLTPGGERLLSGFAALRWIAWRLPLLCPVAPVLHLPGMAMVGQRLYLWVARRRFRLVPCHGGVCTIQHSFSGEPKATRSSQPAPDTERLTG